MRNTEFTSWLAGFFSICDPNTLTEQQVECISNHAKLCEYTEKNRLTVTNHMIRYTLDKVSLEDLKIHVQIQFESVPCPSSEEICYFLQGVFEIDGKEKWSRKDVELAIHLLDRNVWGLAPPLVQLYHRMTSFLEKEMSTLDMSDMKAELQTLFVHEIDPMYEYDPDTADRIHNGQEV